MKLDRIKLGDAAASVTCKNMKNMKGKFAENAFQGRYFKDQL